MHHYHHHGDDNGVDDLDSTDSETESRLLVMREIFVHCGGAVVYNELGGHSQSHIKTFPLYGYHRHHMWAIKEENKAMQCMGTK